MIVYDCEIVGAVPGKGQERIDGVWYCDGWDDFQGMGISCICAYDMQGQRSRVFLADNLQEFSRLISAGRMVAGFNNHKFDDQLIRAHGIKVGGSYDIATEVKAASGNPNWRGLSLDALARANGICGKSGSGADAPILWQRGKIGAVIDYCLQDVNVTVNIIRKIMTAGCLVDPRDGRVVKMRSPMGVQS